MHPKFRRRLASVAAFIILGGVAIQAQSPAPETGPARTLVVQYAGGRTVSHLLRSGEFWTPVFPRIEGAQTSRYGLPLEALDFLVTLDGDEPVYLSMASVKTADVPMPAVRCVSPLLDVRVAPITPGVTSYGVQVANHSNRPLVSIDWRAMRGQARAQQAMVAGMQMAKDAARNDLNALARSDEASGPSAYSRWLERMITDYTAWLARAGHAAR
jgi:hypothetical protein